MKRRIFILIVVLSYGCFPILFAQNISIKESLSTFEFDNDQTLTLLYGQNFKGFKTTNGYLIYFERYKYYYNAFGKTSQNPYCLTFDKNKKFKSLSQIQYLDYDFSGNVEDVLQYGDRVFMFFSQKDEGTPNIQLWCLELNPTNGSVVGKPKCLLNQSTASGVLGNGMVVTPYSKKPYVYSIMQNKDKIEISYGKINDNFTLDPPTKFYHIPSGLGNSIKFKSFIVDEMGNGHLLSLESVEMEKPKGTSEQWKLFYTHYNVSSKRTIIHALAGKNASTIHASMGFDQDKNAYVFAGNEMYDEFSDDAAIFWIHKIGTDGKLLKEKRTILDELQREQLFGTNSAFSYKLVGNKFYTSSLGYKKMEFNFSKDGKTGGLLAIGNSTFNGGYYTDSPFLWLTFNTSTLGINPVVFGKSFTFFNGLIGDKFVVNHQNHLSLLYLDSEKNYESNPLKPTNAKNQYFNIDNSTKIFSCQIDNTLATNYKSLWQNDNAEIVKLYPIKFSDSEYFILRWQGKGKNSFDLLQLTITP